MTIWQTDKFKRWQIYKRIKTPPSHLLRPNYFVVGVNYFIGLLLKPSNYSVGLLLKPSNYFVGLLLKLSNSFVERLWKHIEHLLQIIKLSNISFTRRGNTGASWSRSTQGWGFEKENFWVEDWKKETSGLKIEKRKLLGWKLKKKTSGLKIKKGNFRVED